MVIKMTETKEIAFQPLLLGSDINVYGMARSFYEEYGIVSVALASDQLAPTKYSKIVNVHVHPGFDTDPVFIEVMREYAKTKDATKPYLVIACGDGYAELVAKHREELTKDYVCPGNDYHLFEKLLSKVSFYNVCEEYQLPYPKTVIITKEMAENPAAIELTFDFPVALKPANSVEYLSAQFEGRKKAFTIKTREEFELILGRVYEAGYTSEMICQDFIPGDDSHMRVLNVYVDHQSNVRMMCLGHPLLEDPTPAAIGNYVAILPDYNEKIYQTIQNFLETIHYRGFANFDMKYDPRDGEYKLFEINLRQGRSSFYVTLNGYNLARYVTEDLIFNRPFEQTIYGKGDTLWMGVPKKIFTTYVKDGSDKDRGMAMIHKGNYGTTVFYNKDRNFRRHLLMRYMFYNYHGRFKKYFKENKG